MSIYLRFTHNFSPDHHLLSLRYVSNCKNYNKKIAVFIQLFFDILSYKNNRIPSVKTSDIHFEGTLGGIGGRDSSVGIATRYGLDGPGFETR
jgi:hypothetical protein